MHGVTVLPRAKRPFTEGKCWNRGALGFFGKTKAGDHRRISFKTTQREKPNTQAKTFLSTFFLDFVSDIKLAFVPSPAVP